MEFREAARVDCLIFVFVYAAAAHGHAAVIRSATNVFFRHAMVSHAAQRGSHTQRLPAQRLLGFSFSQFFQEPC